MKIVTADQMRALEAESAAAGVSTADLMERAGLAFAREVRTLLGGAAGRRLTVLVGPGNNGGDGLVACRHLVDWGAEPAVLLLAGRPAEDPHLTAVLRRGVSVFRTSESLDLLETGRSSAGLRPDAILDAGLGTGRSRPLGGPMKAALDLADAQVGPLKVALDLPTGLDADTGFLDPAAFHADVTVTLGFPKVGLYRWPGMTAAGRVIPVDIGLPNGLATSIQLELITAASVAQTLPSRRLDANKGTFGRVLVIAGSGSFVGAAALACRGAHRAGAGLVTLATPAPLVDALAGTLTETTYIPLPSGPNRTISQAAAANLEIDGYDAVAIGCGLSQDPETASFLDTLLLHGNEVRPPVVLDADALNLLAGRNEWWRRFQGKAVLTPHPGEMARLLSCSVPEVQEDRVAIARAAAAAWSQTVLLKGAHTVVARPGGLTRLSPYANPALASGGTGDVLTGIIAGLIAQGMEPFKAAAAGAFLHGKAAEIWSASHGTSGLLAGDLVALVPDVMREVRG